MELHLNSGPLLCTVQLPESATVFGKFALDSSANVLASALLNPVQLPQVFECVVPGDRVAIVVDPATPAAASLVSQVWEQFQTAYPEELEATLLLPPAPQETGWTHLLDDLPLHVRNQMAVHIHNPADETQRSYLASSANGERVYLSHYLTDADLIVTIGTISFDPVLGYTGTTSGLYPVFSDQATLDQIRHQQPDESEQKPKYPLRELVDEIGWLLGTQFAVQVIPSADGQIAAAFCGAPDKVMSQGIQSLNAHWRVNLQQPFDLAVVSIPGHAASAWKHLGAALEVASQMVEEGGQIAIVAELPADFGPGIELLRRSPEPENVLKPLRKRPTTDAFETLQIVSAVQNYRLYLYSRLDPGITEDLGLLPLATEAELQRLIDAANRIVAVPCANYAQVERVGVA